MSGVIPYNEKDWWRAKQKSNQSKPGEVIPYDAKQWYNLRLQNAFKNIMNKIGIDSNKYFSPYSIAEALGIMCVEGECEEGTIGYFISKYDEEQGCQNKVAIFPKEVFHDMKQFNKSLSFMLATDFVNVVEIKNDYRTQKQVQKLLKRAIGDGKKVNPNYELSDAQKMRIETSCIMQVADLELYVPVDYETLLGEDSSVASMINLINKYRRKDEQKIL